MREQRNKMLVRISHGIQLAILRVRHIYIYICFLFRFHLCLLRGCCLGDIMWNWRAYTNTNNTHIKWIHLWILWRNIHTAENSCGCVSSHWFNQSNIFKHKCKWVPTREIEREREYRAHLECAATEPTTPDNIFVFSTVLLSCVFFYFVFCEIVNMLSRENNILLFVAAKYSINCFLFRESVGALARARAIFYGYFIIYWYRLQNVQSKHVANLEFEMKKRREMLCLQELPSL